MLVQKSMIINMELMKVNILAHQQAEEHNASTSASTPCIIFSPTSTPSTKLFPSPLALFLLPTTVSATTGGPSTHTLTLLAHPSKRPAITSQKLLPTASSSSTQTPSSMAVSTSKTSPTRGFDRHCELSSRISLS